MCILVVPRGPEISGRPNNSLSSLVDLKTGEINRRRYIGPGRAGRRLVKKSLLILLSWHL
jgi:hypothetical protein